MVKKIPFMRLNEMKLNQAIVYGDRHTAITSESCDRILKNYMKDNKSTITHIVDVGDMVDNPFMSIFDVNPEFTLSAQEEFDLYSAHIKEMQTIVPKAKIHLIPGNHDKSRLNNSKKLNRGLASLRNLEFENVLYESMIQNKVNLKNFKIHNRTCEIMFTKNDGVLFTHGDPRLDYNVKGGVTGVRRTAETYPTQLNIIMGHGHRHFEIPRRYPNTKIMMIGGMFNIPKMKKSYFNMNPYENGFAIIYYNKKTNFFNIQYVDITKNGAYVNGKIYS